MTSTTTRIASMDEVSLWHDRSRALDRSLGVLIEETCWSTHHIFRIGIQRTDPPPLSKVKAALLNDTRLIFDGRVNPRGYLSLSSL